MAREDIRVDLPRPATLSSMEPAQSGASSPLRSRTNRVLMRIRNTPEGFVRSYGDVSPGAPRFAGTVLSRYDGDDVPWWRIVPSDGSLAKGTRQRALLE